MSAILRNSDKPHKRYVIEISNDKIHFGDDRYENYTMHQDNKRRKNYISRHKPREVWNKYGIFTPGFWSRWLLWEKPTLSAAIKNIKNKFGITIKNAT